MEPLSETAPATLPSALRYVGNDVLEVLHRVSTNDVASLPVGGARTTLFCDFRGRLLHRAVVVNAGAEGIWLIGDSPGQALAAFVDARVFREDVRLAAGPVPVPAAYAPLAHEAFGEDERVRIEAGLPRYGHEIAEEFNPYEAGRAAEVHLAKGCYTGQEALQRLVTYHSVRRRLARVRGAGEPPALQDVVLHADVVGRLTSATATGSGWIGLAIVRVQALEGSEALALADGTPLAGVSPVTVAAPLGRG